MQWSPVAIRKKIQHPREIFLIKFLITSSFRLSARCFIRILRVSSILNITCIPMMINMIVLIEIYRVFFTGTPLKS